MLVTPLLFSGLTLALAGVTDLKTGKIPNILTFGSLLAALLYLIFRPQYAFNSICGLFTLSLLPLLLFYYSKGQGVGGGDIKLLAALGAWLGPEAGLALTLSALTMATLVGLGLSISQRRSLRTIHLRLGPYFAAAFILLLLFSYVREHCC